MFRWRPACWLRVGGADAFGFLQAQFTNDLRALDAGPAVYGLWLDVKGKIVADSFVLKARHQSGFWIGSYASPAQVIRQRLESHIVADDVTVEDLTAEWAGITVFGEAVGPGTRSDAVGMECTAFPGRRMRGGHEEWMFRIDDRPGVEAVLGDRVELGPDAIELMRIGAAIPSVPADAGPGDLPGEAALEADAISYTKGCYLGQEVMARLRSMGRVRRRLLRVRGRTEDLPGSLPAPLFAGSRAAGELRSAARDGDGFIGLAMLVIMHVSAGGKLGFAADGRPAVELVDAP